MTVSGKWNLVINSPVGKQQAVLELVETDGTVIGTASSGDEGVELKDITRDGDRLSWAQKVTKPFPMVVTFDVTVTGDELAGTAKPGSFPGSKVTGTRV